MASPFHYKSNLRDAFFNLFEVLDIGRTVLGQGPFANLDEATMKDTLVQLEKLATNELAASFVDGDRIALKFDEKTGSVTLPESVKKSLKAWFDGGWHMLECAEHLGGVNAPPTVCWAVNEMTVGANPSVSFYGFGTFISRTIDALGTEKQKKLFSQRILDSHWGGTMQLSEPQAGSDVGEGRCKAKHVKDDLWELTGTKCWITNGDFDSAANIVHLVLARPEGGKPGTKGLSLFIVPKFWVNEDGSLGERNGVVTTSIEHKMGIKGSATCVMEFGGDTPAKGFLVGDTHDGIAQMFRVIEQARMFIGVKSMATVSTAYLNALAYAKDRVQGGNMLRIMDKTSPRVRIIEHPDVRRMLMLQKALAEGMRALCFYGASLQDSIELKGGHGHGTDDDAKKALERRNDFLLPLIKGYNSEKGYQLLNSALQVFGGAGYTQDFPIEQYIRDQKIDTLYEGTTHIQALDLIFRKIARDNGETMMGLFSEIQQVVDGDAGGDALKSERESLGKAAAQVQGIFGVMMPRMTESLYHVGLHANRILFSLAEVVIGWLLVKQAAVALKKLPEATGADKDFYEGKLAAVRFYCKEVLPEIALHKKIIEGGDLALMDVPESAF
ncbi:MAG: acyl-CoA dehydrogenase [Deltaproteobacteria bacterium]|nr:acyl-CoA dehydrogenase [Deltaproteobacteria bacterium]